MNKQEQALRNCLLLAMRERHRERLTKGTGAEPSAWDHIIRFCGEGGIKPSPLRAEDNGNEQ